MVLVHSEMQQRNVIPDKIHIIVIHALTPRTVATKVCTNTTYDYISWRVEMVPSGTWNKYIKLGNDFSCMKT